MTAGALQRESSSVERGESPVPAPPAGWWARRFEGVDNGSLVVFRAAFGALLVWEVLRYSGYGWVADNWIVPEYHFTYQFFDWVRPLPGAGMHLVFALLGSLAACMAVGFLYRPATLLLGLGFAYVFLIDKATYLNHLYLIVLLLLLMVLVPAHRSFSFDALLRPGIRSKVAPRWTLELLKLQIGLVYVFGGIAKMNGDWLRGRPMDEWLAEKSDAPLVGPLLDEPWSPYLFSWGGLAFDLLIVPLLLWRRTRPFAVVAAVGFHLTNSQLFHIGVFPWFMIAATTLFLAPDWPRRALAAVRGRPDRDTGRRGAASGAAAGGPAGGSTPGPSRRTVWVRRAGAAALAVYLAVQVALPFRHLLYPGNVHWNEEGHRFSWHMKLRDKESETILFVAHSARTGRATELDPEDFLTENQVEEMATRPDMILQFARYLAAESERQGLGPVRVYARAKVSLNGRPAQTMVDPRVDLAAQPRSLGHSEWILPLASAD